MKELLKTEAREKENLDYRRDFLDNPEALTREQFRWAVSIRDRFTGLLFSKEDKDVLVLVPCKDIHTAFMKKSIDVAFIDKYGVVIKSYRKLKPFSRKREHKACAVFERFACEEDAWFSEGDRVELMIMKRRDEKL